MNKNILCDDNINIKKIIIVIIMEMKVFLI